MNRRRFLKWASLAPALGALFPWLKRDKPKPFGFYEYQKDALRMYAKKTLTDDEISQMADRTLADLNRVNWKVMHERAQMYIDENEEIFRLVKDYS